MKKIDSFRRALRAVLATSDKNRLDLARETGLQPAVIYRFLRKDNPLGLSGEAVLRLLPYVYKPLVPLYPDIFYSQSEDNPCPEKKK
jgi:hypothetical protein